MSETRFPLPSRVALLGALALAGCGGGGGGGLPPPDVSFSVTPNSILLGQSATLQWTGSTGTNCNASGGWTGSLPASGTRSVTPTAAGSQTYTIECAGGEYSGSTSRTATLTVTAPATLAQVQAQVFTPSCTGCHNGSAAPDGPLPGSMNLTSGNAFGAIVGVASRQQPALARVTPGNAADSYLVRKIEGVAGINGQRMPLGGPALDAATIDLVRTWIASGAPNN